MKKLNRRIACAFLSVAMLASLCACGNNTANQTPENSGDDGNGGSSATYVMKIATVSPEGHPATPALAEMCERIEERSDGRIDAQFYPGSQLGSETDTYEGLMMGSVQAVMNGSMALSNFSDALAFMQLPMLFPGGRDALYEFMDGECGELIRQRLADECNMRAWLVDDGTYDFAASTEIRTVEDFSKLKMRVQDCTLFTQTMTLLGANPVPMAFSEIYTGLQQGTIQGTTANWLNLYSGKFYECTNYYNNMGLFNNVLVLGINLDWYNSLPEDLQTIVDEEFERVCYETYGRQIATFDEDFRAKVEEDGHCQIVEYTPEEIAAIRAAVQPIYDSFPTQYDEPNFDLYMSTIDELNAKYGA